MSKTIIVSNRLPVRMHTRDGKTVYKPSEGGLATGLSSVYKGAGNVWIGWPGKIVQGEQAKARVIEDLKPLNLCPVFLTREEIDDYYEGFSNEVLWPICHYVPSYAQFNHRYWEAYKTVNRKFAEAVLQLAETGDTVWINDYQLLLVPFLVREKMPEISIGFFQHIPFPSYEIFRQIPWREALLEGVLGADLIGFHTYDDIRHFISAVTRIMGVNTRANYLVVHNRRVIVDAFPMGIDYEKFVEITSLPSTKSNIRKIRASAAADKIVLSIDRLDYSKGILERLLAFELFLKTHRNYREKVSLLMVVVPSRDEVPQYRELKEEIDRLVSDINARNQTLGWQPVFYFYRSFPVEMLSALYQMADVCLVTPKRDGMNLVSKEYVASRIDEHGVLILSEMAGASKELLEAIIINPNDIPGLADALLNALQMPVAEQHERMSVMRKTVEKFNIHHWVKLFMQRLKEVKNMQQSLATRQLSTKTFDLIQKKYDDATKRIIFLDYDGTLVGFNVNPLRARPDKELFTLLDKLMGDDRNRLILISGRKHETLDEWYSHLPLDMIAEHGAWTKKYEEPWRRYHGLSDVWKKEIMPVMENYADRTPGAFIEEKSYSLSWHYRKAETGLGEQRAMELEDNLKFFAEDQELQILQGEKVIEVKSNLINKGKAAEFWLEEDNYDFVMALGDDFTDEYTFRALPDDAVTIKVGNKMSVAKYSVPTYKDVRKLLFSLSRL
ncbi:MAG TPA: bifunctional alpha,alpha-trehalose-phosphate synthase (UDP-forming)/trehalose-phosphatase [Anseongella sp.]